MIGKSPRHGIHGFCLLLTAPLKPKVFGRLGRTHRFSRFFLRFFHFLGVPMSLIRNQKYSQSFGILFVELTNWCCYGGSFQQKPCSTSWTVELCCPPFKSLPPSNPSAKHLTVLTGIRAPRSSTFPLCTKASKSCGSTVQQPTLNKTPSQIRVSSWVSTAGY